MFILNAIKPEEMIRVQLVKSEDQLADSLMDPLPRTKCEKMTAYLELQN